MIWSSATMDGHANNPSGETITLAKEKYDGLKRDLETALNDKENLRRELEIERALTVDERLEAASKLIEAFKPIVDHACANLAPEFIRDLPAEAYEEAARLVGTAVGATQRDEERAVVWSQRAELIQTWRDKRKARGWGEDAEPAGAARTPDEATAVATATIHNARSTIAVAARELGFKLVKRGKPGRKPGQKNKPKAKAKTAPKKRRATGRRGESKRR